MTTTAIEDENQLRTVAAENFEKLNIEVGSDVTLGR
jgi:hypothetical protein